MEEEEERLLSSWSPMKQNKSKSDYTPKDITREAKYNSPNRDKNLNNLNKKQNKRLEEELEESNEEEDEENCKPLSLSSDEFSEDEDFGNKFEDSSSPQESDLDITTDERTPHHMNWKRVYQNLDDTIAQIYNEVTTFAESEIIKIQNVKLDHGVTQKNKTQNDGTEEEMKPDDVVQLTLEPTNTEDLDSSILAPNNTEDLAPLSLDPVNTEDLDALSLDPVNTEDLAPLSLDPVNTEDLDALSLGPVNTEVLDALSLDPDPVNTEDLDALTLEPNKSKKEKNLTADESDPLTLKSKKGRKEKNLNTEDPDPLTHEQNKGKNEENLNTEDPDPLTPEPNIHKKRNNLKTEDTMLTLELNKNKKRKNLNIEDPDPTHELNKGKKRRNLNAEDPDPLTPEPNIRKTRRNLNAEDATLTHEQNKGKNRKNLSAKKVENLNGKNVEPNKGKNIDSESDESLEMSKMNISIQRDKKLSETPKLYKCIFPNCTYSSKYKSYINKHGKIHYKKKCKLGKTAAVNTSKKFKNVKNLSPLPDEGESNVNSSILPPCERNLSDWDGSPLKKVGKSSAEYLDSEDNSYLLEQTNQEVNSPINSPHKKQKVISPINSPHKNQKVNSPINSPHKNQKVNSPINSPHKKQKVNSPINSPHRNQKVNSPHRNQKVYSPINSPHRNQKVNTPNKDRKINSPKKNRKVTPHKNQEDNSKSKDAVENRRCSSASHKCEQCDFSTVYKNNLSRHMVLKHKSEQANPLTETAGENNVCLMCGFTTLYKNNLNRHINLKHGGSITEVPLTNQVLDPLKIDDDADNIQWSQTNHTCLKCGFTTAYKNSLTRHMILKHSAVLESPLTEMSITNQVEDLPKFEEDTEIIEWSTINYKCSKCNFSTAYKNSLARHKIVKHSDVQANSLTEIPITNQVENAIENSECPTTNHNCSKCEFTTAYKNSLTRHMILKHSREPEISIKYKVEGDTENNENSIINHKCLICGFTTAYKISLTKHMVLKHSADQASPLNEMPTINQILIDSLKTENYTENQCSNTTHKCLKCGFSTIYKNSLYRHMILKHAGRARPIAYKSSQLKRTITGDELPDFLKSIKTENNLNPVMEEHSLSTGSENQPLSTETKFRLYTCSKCSYETDNLKLITVHKGSHHITSNKIGWLNNNISTETKMFGCFECDFSTRYSGLLRRHEMHHSNYKNKIALTMERLENSDDGTIEKDNEYFQHSENDLKSTVEDEINVITYDDISPEEDDLRKKLKNKGTKTENEMDEGLNIIESKVYKCFECNFVSRNKHRVKKHQQKHTNSVNDLIVDTTLYKCSKCSFSSTTKFYIKKHLLSHRRQKSSYRPPNNSKGGTEVYKCTLCVYTSTYRHNFKRHIIKMHASEDAEDLIQRVTKNTGGNLEDEDCRKYECEICGYKAKYKANFYNHKVIHKKKKVYFQCSTCDYKTLWKYNLKKHEWQHLPTKKLKCELCNYATNFKSNLQLHHRNNHK